MRAGTYLGEDLLLGGMLRSTHCTCGRGVMMLRTGLSARSRTPSIMSRSTVWITPRSGTLSDKIVNVILSHGAF